jgi:site-specific DNA-methyltransferase (adenine-specific)/modification methylase
MSNIKLLHGDCLGYLKLIKDNTCDLAITSPPYNMNLRVRNGKHCSRQIVKEISTKYANYSNNLSMEEYFNFNVKVLNQLLRVSHLVFYNVQFLTGNKQALYKLLGHFNENVKEFIIWDKINAEPAIGSGVLNSRFEVLIVLASKEEAITRQFKKGNFNRGTLENLWQIKRGKKVIKTHGATYPIELVNKIITNFSAEGDTIIDPFMGTGTTGLSCKKNNRNFIGIELDKDYFNFASESLNKF